MTNIARDGAAKRLQNCPVHDGMFHMRNGQLITAVSKTQTGNPTAIKSKQRKRLAGLTMSG